MNTRSPSGENQARVLVAYEPGDVQRQIVKLVGSLGFDPLTADDGVEAADILKTRKPDLMVVDAGIAGRASFELCDFIRAQQLPTRVILVASVYRKTRYKRRPASLYGADDYVEQHHIHDKLPQKMSAALGGGGQWDASRFVDSELLRRFGDQRLAFEDVEGPAVLEKARRLAWIIVSDMALYNPELIRSAGDPQKATVEADLAEGRRLFRELVPDELDESEDFIGEALRRMREGRF